MVTKRIPQLPQVVPQVATASEAPHRRRGGPWPDHHTPSEGRGCGKPRCGAEPDPGVAALVLAEEARPGWVFRPAAAGVWVAVTPWPEYGEGGAPAWSAKVVRFGGGASRRYWLVWSGRLRRWVKNHEEGRLRRDASAEELRAIDGFMCDTLEGARC